MKKAKKIILYFFLGLMLLIVSAQFAIAEKFDAKVQVIEGEKKVGVNPTMQNLDFGDLSADTTATRYVALRADGADTLITVLTLGSIRELIQLKENNFVMEKGDEARLELNLHMPPSAPIGEKYGGKILIFKTPKFW